MQWSALGFEPRWVGFDTADCVAALQPSIFSGHGADEFNLFRQGAESRGETALVISPIGQLDGGETRNAFSTHDDSVYLGRVQSTIGSQPLGKGARVRAVGGLGDADGQLALRLLSCNPALRWQGLALHGVTLEAYDGTVHHPAQGTLEPIIETELGEPVVAAWVSPDGVERRYVVPSETPWPVLLKWLLEQALPEFVPGPCPTSATGAQPRCGRVNPDCRCPTPRSSGRPTTPGASPTTSTRTGRESEPTSRPSTSCWPIHVFDVVAADPHQDQPAYRLT